MVIVNVSSQEQQAFGACFKKFGLEGTKWWVLKKCALCACSIFFFITYLLSVWATTGRLINMCQYLWIVVESLLIFLLKENKPTFPVLFNVLGSNEDANPLSFVYAFISTKVCFSIQIDLKNFFKVFLKSLWKQKSSLSIKVKWSNIFL